MTQSNQESDNLYPHQADNLDFFGHLNEIRKRIFICIISVVVTSIISFSFGNQFILLSRKPINGFVESLVFLTPQEVFVSYIRVSIVMGIILSVPVILMQLWMFVSPAVKKEDRRKLLIWIFGALLFFSIGLCFSYFIAFPAAVNFLLNFGKDVAVPAISLEKYISFFCAFIFIGGIVFEIPIVIGLLTDIGMVTPIFLKQKRKYAILIIVVAAAIITPTQDIFNMLIYAVPMVLLFESGIILSILIDVKRKRKDR